MRVNHVLFGDRFVGCAKPVYFIAECGINHNGSLDTALRMVRAACLAGCDAVKFQKRTVDVVYSSEDLARPRESVFGDTNGDLKRGLEFGHTEYAAIRDECDCVGIDFLASCWDEESVEFIDEYHPVAHKIASPMLTDLGLISMMCRSELPLIVSTGMSTVAQISRALDAISVGGVDCVLLHCVSIYPTPDAACNIASVEWLHKHFDLPVGYSGHEVGLAPSLLAVALGACVIERHFTLDRSMWGSDQASSLEPQGMKKLIDYARSMEAAIGHYEKVVQPGEIPNLTKLRRINE